jgi:hypothetical protein
MRRLFMSSLLNLAPISPERVEESVWQLRNWLLSGCSRVDSKELSGTPEAVL